MGLFLLHAFLLSRHTIRQSYSLYRGESTFFLFFLQRPYFPGLANKRYLERTWNILQFCSFPLPKALGRVSARGCQCDLPHMQTASGRHRARESLCAGLTAGKILYKPAVRAVLSRLYPLSLPAGLLQAVERCDVCGRGHAGLCCLRRRCCPTACLHPPGRGTG